MSTGVATQPEAAPARRPDRGWTLLRQVLLVVALVLVAAAVGLGERVSSLGDLENDLAAGRVDSVEVAGGLAPGHTGFLPQRVTWRNGLVRHVVEVTQASSRQEAAEARGSSDEQHPVLLRDVGARLVDERPDLTVVRAGPRYPTIDYEVWGWALPGYLQWPVIGLYLLSFVLLVNGPEPWRATRWAWFWLFAVPGGLVMFLLLSGTGPLPPPRRPQRRLRGGWAFVLALVLH